MKMSRDSRRIVNHLELKTGSPIPPSDLYELESLTFSYYPKFVLEAIDKFYNPKSKKDFKSILFYSKPVRSMNKARRNKDDWAITSDSQMENLWKISNYLLDDYNQEQQIIVRDIVDNYTPTQVQMAIDTARNEKVFNINYLQRVIEGIKSRDDYEKNKILERRKYFLDKPINEPEHRRPVYQLASMMAEFQESIENIGIIKQLNSLEDDE